MANIILTLKNFFTSSKMITVYWQTANCFVVGLIGVLTVIKPDEVNATVFLILGGCVAVLNRVTKEINKKYI